jgi:hypothetical protein
MEIKSCFHRQKGQVIADFAIFLPILALTVIMAIDFLITTGRAMETISAADLAAHAGAQEVKLLRNGKIEPNGKGPSVAAYYFALQKPAHARFVSASCGLSNNRPACEVVAETTTSGFFLPERPVRIRSVGYLAYGSTRDDQ